MRSTRFRSSVAVLVALVLSTAGLVCASVPAHAAPLICTHVNDVWNNQGGEDQTAVSYPTVWGDVKCDFRQDETWNNPAVTLLQWTLNTCYGPNAFYAGHHRGVTRQLTTEGKYGPNTREAVREFQRWWNSGHDPDVTVDGYAGPNTRSKMKWVSNGLYGAKCSSVNYNPPGTVTAPAGRREYVAGDAACLVPDGLGRAYTLHGKRVEIRTNRCNASARAIAYDIPASANAVLSIDRTTFDSPTSCNGGDCYRTSAEIGSNYQGYNPRHTYWDASVRDGANIRTLYVEGLRNYVRPCLLMNGYYECGNMWYADIDA